MCQVLDAKLKAVTALAPSDTNLEIRNVTQVHTKERRPLDGIAENCNSLYLDFRPISEWMITVWRLSLNHLRVDSRPVKSMEKSTTVIICIRRKSSDTVQHLKSLPKFNCH